MGLTQSLPKVTAQDRAILDLKLQRDKLKQYQKKIQHLFDRELDIAKSYIAAGDKDRAMTALRRRRYQEGLLSKTDTQLANLEALVSTIEFTLIEVSVFHGLKQGNEVLKEIHRQMSVEDVEKLIGETQEAREYQEEIGNLLANQLSRDDEVAVQKELLELQKMHESVPLEQLPSVPVTPLITTSPSGKDIISHGIVGQTSLESTAPQRVAMES